MNENAACAGSCWQRCDDPSQKALYSYHVAHITVQMRNLANTVVLLSGRPRARYHRAGGDGTIAGFEWDRSGAALMQPQMAPDQIAFTAEARRCHIYSVVRASLMNRHSPRHGTKLHLGST